MQDLNDMLYFAEVVDRGGFAAAGRALGIPKSRLSRRVAELEARLGVRLMQRTTRKLSLTEAGERYHRHCAAMRDEAAAAAEAVAQAQRRTSGSLGAQALHELIALLRNQSLSAMERFREVSPQLRRHLSAERFEQLQEQIDSLQFDDAADLLAHDVELPA